MVQICVKVEKLLCGKSGAEMAVAVISLVWIRMIIG